MPPQREARLLAESLRSSRLTTLYGAAGSGKTSLLHDAVLPLLHRRASDLAVPQDLLLRGVVLPFPDRRRANGNRRNPEIAVCFDDWRSGIDAPLDRLLMQLHDAIGIAAPQHDGDSTMLPGQHALVATLTALESRFGVRFLVIFDSFEQCLNAAAERPAIGEFLDELAHALERPQLPANFLIALRDDAKPQLDGLLANVPWLGDNVLHLSPVAAQRPPLTGLHQVPAAALADPAPPEPAAANLDAPANDGWQSSIDAIMERVSAVARVGSAPSPPDADVPDVPDAPDEPAAVAPAPPPEIEAKPPALPQPPPETIASPAPPRVRRVWLAVPALALAVLGYSAWRISRPAADAEAPRASASPTLPAPVPAKPAVAVRPAAVPAAVASAAVPPAAVPSAPVPSAPVLVLAPAARGIDDRPATVAELAGALPAAQSRVTPAWPAGFDAVPGHPGLALARYDALRALQRSGGASPLQVVAPLYTEPMLFVARADSPLAFIHDIESARIYAGPAGSSRALTAAAIYQRLFGKPLSATPAAAEGGDAALGRLLRSDGVDVLVLSGPQLDQLWSALPPATARALKLLPRADANPADQRALQAYLPATVLGTPSFAVMNFLVADSSPGAASAAQALCAALPELKRNGNPKWRELQPGLQLPTGWPSPAAAQQAWRACAASGR